ncbi:MAG: hypothetical protein K6G80_09085 [Treponema sp.]|nr:hypothetical protein [Treponema sp.]
MRKLLVFAAASVAALLFNSCASAPKAALNDNDVYAYDFERVYTGVEQAARSRMSGYEYSQTVKKSSSGYAVSVQNRTFVVPELNLALSVDKKGAVFCDDNASVRGMLKKDGTLQWQGFVLENAQVVQITESGRLVKSERSDRAGAEFDGVYSLQNDAGGTLVLSVQDGLSLATVADQTLPFEPQPVIVYKDGSFASRFVLTTEQTLGGYGKTTFSTEYTATGALHAGGKVSMNTLTTTGGNVVPVSSAPFVYAGDRSRQTIAGAEAVDVRKKLAAAASAKNVPPYPKKVPAWYTEDTPHADGVYTACGMKIDADETVAKAIAEAEAAGKLSSMIALQLSSEVQADKTMGTAGTNFALHTVTEAVSALQLDYSVLHTEYDAASGCAFVAVSMTDAQLAAVRKTLSR